MTIQQQKKFKILLVGDSCTDVYQYGNVNSAYVDEQGRLAGAATSAADAVAGGSTTNDAAAPIVAPPPPPVVVKPNSVGPTIPVTNRGNFDKPGKPTGSNVPKNPKPGMSFKGSGGVTFVYRGDGPKGKGWYSK